MANTTKERKRIASLDRMKSSRNGNPRYRVTFMDGTSAPTEPYAMLAYGITNRDYRDNDVLVTLNGRGHITYLEVAK